MNVCSNGHEEICYVENVCPLCSLQVEYKVLEKEKESLQKHLDIMIEERNYPEETENHNA